MDAQNPRHNSTFHVRRHILPALCISIAFFYAGWVVSSFLTQTGSSIVTAPVTPEAPVVPSSPSKPPLAHKTPPPLPVSPTKFFVPPAKTLTSVVTTAALKSTALFVRYENTPSGERLHGPLNTYAPFFHSIHHSIPGYVTKPQDDAKKFDSWQENDYAYQQVGQTMKELRNRKEAVSGMLFMDMDVWLDPPRFSDMDYNSMWQLDTGLPPSMCSSTARIKVELAMQFQWWAWDQNKHMPALQALNNLKKDTGLDIPLEKICWGMSNMYYIPYAAFAAFEQIADYFYQERVWWEIAIPTIISLVESVYKINNSRMKEGDGGCWGNCCTQVSEPSVITKHKCGHKWDTGNEEQRRIILDRLKSYGQT